jgi:hypothetical protein
MEQNKFKHYIKLILFPISVFCILMAFIDKNIQVALIGVILQILGLLTDYAIYGRESKE